MTDAERVNRLDSAREAFEQIASDEGVTSEGIMAGGLATAFEVLASLIRTRTAPPEPQDVSDELLAKLINAAAFASNTTHSRKDERRFGLMWREACDIQRVRAAQREGE